MKNNQLSINRLSKTPFELEFDEKTEWMADILKSLHEDLEEKDRILKAGKEQISFKGEARKVMGSRYGDYVLLRGDVEATFFTYCVQSGELMEDRVISEIKACFLEEEAKERFDLEEETTLYLNDDEYEIYFLDNHWCNIPEVVNEHIFLNKNPYPKKN
ncbi:MAG: hypothetical protein ACPGJV_14330 [Bacteriovoracaceae bacterium]